MSRASWWVVLIMALLLAGVDGFWSVSLQGAVGAVERARHPSRQWLLDSALTTPLYALAVLGALGLACRWFGTRIEGLRGVVVAILLITASTTVIGLGRATVSAAQDYLLQSAQVRRTALLHSAPGAPSQSTGVGQSNGAGRQPVSPAAVGCDTACLAERATIATHLRGLSRLVPLLLISNLVVTGWVAAVAGGRLTRRPGGRHPAPGRSTPGRPARRRPASPAEPAPGAALGG